MRRGSFGLLVRDLAPRETDDDDRLILTAAHLVDGLPDETRILSAPAGPEPAITDGRYCGKLRRRVPLHHLPHIGVDAAVIKPPGRVDCCNEMACGETAGIRDLWVVKNQAEVISVRKHGAQTQLTEGHLMPAAADHFMEDMRARYTSGWWAYGNGGPFAAPGDSGAIVVDDERLVIGMVVAVDRPGHDAAAFVHGARQIFSALQIAPL